MFNDLLDANSNVFALGASHAVSDRVATPIEANIKTVPAFFDVYDYFGGYRAVWYRKALPEWWLR
jgi:hypothetical protein